MNTMFSLKFDHNNWSNRLGQDEFVGPLPPAANEPGWFDFVKEGLNFSSDLVRLRAAEEQRKAEQARADAIRASQTGMVTPASDGIPTSYLLIGAAGLAAVGLVVALAR